MAVAEIEGFKKYLAELDGQSYYEKWRVDNPGQRKAWDDFASRIVAGQNPTPPSMAGKFGRALVEAGKLALLRGNGGGPSAAPFG